MSINYSIRSYLVNRRTELYETVKSDSLASSFRAKFELVSTDNLKQQYYQELVANCDEDWQYAVEPMDGLLVEYGAPFTGDERTTVYGIVLDNPNGFNVQAEPYAFPSGYDFCQPIEALPGVTLSLFKDLPSLMLSDDGRPIHTPDEIVEMYLMTFYISLHDAIADFVLTEQFGRLPLRKPFHFIINRHDSLST